MADESGSIEKEPVKKKIVNRLTQEQVGKIVAYILPRKAEFTGKSCKELAKLFTQELGVRCTKDNVHAIAGFDFVALPLAEPVKGKSAFFVKCTERLKEQAEAIEELRTKVKIIEETLQAHANVPNDLKDLFKNDIEAGSRIEFILKRLNLTTPVKPI